MANDLNSVNIIGRLTKDSTLKTFQNDSGVLNFSIAVNRRQKNGEEWSDYASYFEVSYFSKGASKLSPYLVKGAQVGISGYLKQDRWEKDGKKNAAVKIIAEGIELVGGKQNGDTNEDQQPSTNGQTNNGYMGNDDFPEDIPF